MAFAHFTLATRDVVRTNEFFAATFLWRSIEQPANIARPAAWLEIGPGQEMHLVEVADFTPSAFEREFGRHIALFYPAGKFAALKERLVAHGAELIEPLRETPFERFLLRDPNGYVFEVIDANRC